MSSNSNQHVVKGWTMQHWLETHIHEAVNFLLIRKAFVRLGKVSHREFNIAAQTQFYVVSHANHLINTCFYDNFLGFCSSFLVLLFLEHGSKVHIIPTFAIFFRIKGFCYLFLLLFFLLFLFVLWLCSFWFFTILILILNYCLIFLLGFFSGSSGLLINYLCLTILYIFSFWFRRLCHS